MILCSHCSEANAPSVLNGVDNVTCRKCGLPLLPSIAPNDSCTRRITESGQDAYGEVRLANDAVVPNSDIEKYKLEREIARGGMGAIYSVFEDGIHRNVAMKVMLSKYGSADNAR